MAMKKHGPNEHGLNLVKYMVHKISLKGKNSNKRKKCKNRASITPITITIFLKMWSLTKNPTQFRWGSLKILFWWLLKVTCHCLLWKALSWNKWCCIFVVKFSFLFVNNLFLKSFLLSKKNHGNLCVSYHWKVCNYDNNIWPVDVKVKVWHICHYN